MATRRCTCTHSEVRHETVIDPWSREGLYKGKCTVKGCDSKNYNFDSEGWVRADEREKMGKKKGFG